ncbi:MAG TPA: nuclear transport factor 2 family protein [Mycobacterium sp.]|nr:nuclear transport factor 2 family protein [Mycobacterium sp.]
MTQTIHQLMMGNLLEVFDERDTERRRAAVERIYASDVRWSDDDGVTVGRDALDEKAAALQGTLGPLRFVADGAVHQTTGFGFLAWHLVADGDPTPQVSGFDVAIVRDDLIAELYTVLTKQPAAG